MTENNPSDHDLLIRVDTKLGMLIQTQGQYLDQYGKLLERVVAIEIDRGKRDAQIEEIKTDIVDLRRKSNIVDTINAIGATIAGIIGYIFGQR